MNRKIVLVNDMVHDDRPDAVAIAPIIASFGDRVYTSYKEDIIYDAFITSYIENEKAILNLREKIANNKLDKPSTLALIDPCFSRDGVRYDKITDVHIENYKKLMEVSDIITPNISEACELVGEKYDDYRTKYCTIEYDGSSKEKVNDLSKKLIETFLPLLDKIRFKKNQISVITGIELYNAVLTILDVYDGDHGKRQTTCNYSMKEEYRYGAGNIFNAMFFEATTNGFNLADSLSVATSFVNNSLRFSKDNKFDKNLGIVYEPILHDNIAAIKNKIIEMNKEKKNVRY